MARPASARQRWCADSVATLVGSVRVLWATCDPLFTPRPLGPLLDIARVIDGELREQVEASGQPHEVARALMDELEGRSPSVVVVEDLHWADEATLDVLRLCARRIDSVPALLVLSYRDDGLHPSHPLRSMLGELPSAHQRASRTRALVCDARWPRWRRRLRSTWMSCTSGRAETRST